MVQTFFIVDSDKESKPARACETCYDTVFPLLEQPSDPHLSVTAGTVHSHFTLSGLKSMPCLLLSDGGVTPASNASALMAIDLDSPPPQPKRPLTRIYDDVPLADDLEGSPPVAVMRLKPSKPTARPKSYIQILEEFQERSASGGAAERGASASPSHSPRASRFSVHSTLDGPLDERDEDLLTLADGYEDDARSSLPPTPRKGREDTARRHKRFSLPAVALQTSPVTARPAGAADGRGHRFSLVLGKSSAHSPKNSREERKQARHSLAADRLTELLQLGKKEGAAVER